MSESDESAVPEEVTSLLSTIGDDFGATADQVGAMLRTQYDVDPATIDPDDAEELKGAWESDDTDAVAQKLLDLGVPEEEVELFRSSIDSAQTGSGEVDSAGDRAGRVADGEPVTDEPQAPETPGEPDDATKRYIDQAVARNTPSAADIAREIRSQSNGQAPQQSGGGSGGGGGGDGTQQVLAQALAQKFLNGGGGGGPMAEMGEQLQKASMQRIMSEMTRPRMGEMIEYQMNMSLAEKMGEEWANHYAESMPSPDEMFSMNPPEVDDDDE